MNRFAIIKEHMLEDIPVSADILGAVKALMTPQEILTAELLPAPFIIRPEDFPAFQSLLSYKTEIKNLTLVPVKEPKIHEEYNAIRDNLMHTVTPLIEDSDITLAPNKFSYWLSEDTDQNLIWIKDNTVTEDRVTIFIAKCIKLFCLDPNKIILFERPINMKSKLIKGTFPHVRHIHMWVQKIV